MIPSTAYKWFKLRRFSNWVETDVPFIDDRADKDQALYYTIVFDETTSQEFIVVEWLNNNDETLIFEYYNNSVDMSLDSSTSTIPDPYGLQVLATLVAWEVLYTTDEQALWIWYLRQAYNKLQEMYSNFWTRVKEYRNTVATPAFDLTSIWINLSNVNLNDIITNG